MEVVNLPSDKDSSGNVTKNLLQGRQLPTVLMDTHPDASSYSCFRPPQPRHSLKYSNLKETDSTDHVSGILFSPLANDPSCQLVDDKLPDNNRSKSRSQKIKRHPSSILQLSSSSPAVTSHTSEQTYHGHTFKVCSILRPWFWVIFFIFRCVHARMYGSGFFSRILNNIIDKTYNRFHDIFQCFSKPEHFFLGSDLNYL